MIILTYRLKIGSDMLDSSNEVTVIAVQFVIAER